MNRTLRKLILAGLLLTGAAILPRGSDAAVNDCCTNCWQHWEIDCYNGCSTLACENNCEAHYNTCVYGCNSRPGPHCQV